MLLALQLNNLLDTPGIPPSWIEGTRISGTAFSSDGTMGTIFLADATPVPASSIFLAGFAHASDGRRYVCLWPTIQSVQYLGGVAVRADGAMCVIGAGTIGNRPHGWAMTARGEVIASVSAPELIKDGFGQLQAGHVCMQAIS